MGDAGNDVRLQNCGEVLQGLGGPLVRQTKRLLALDLFEQVAHGAPVAGPLARARLRLPPGLLERLRLLSRHRLQPLKRLQQHLLGAGSELHLGLPQHVVRDFHQLHGRVVLELEPGGEPRRQPRVGVHERLHLLLVTREYHHQVVSEVLHHLEDGVDGFATEGVSVAVDERVRLVHKQDAPERAVHHLLGFDGRLAAVARHQHGPLHLHHLSLAEHAQRSKHLGHDARHRRLARSRVARKHHVQRALADGGKPRRAPLLRSHHPPAPVEWEVGGRLGR
mmetsp:Transcript_47358/g.90411  ORF Transcript_47358/g.90411 Transcript_47358/m.90411 type:complete len:279 (-) Transcript_47358:506-1342(-)